VVAKTQPLIPAQVAEAALASFASRDADQVAANVHADAVEHFLPIGEFRGRAAIRDFWHGLFAAFPDFEIEATRIVADDSNAAVYWQARGTFTGGPFQGIEPTGGRIEILGTDAMEIADGLITRNTVYWDGAAFARDIGLLPPLGSRTERALLAAFNARTRARSLLRRRRR
jgi:predicted ester cyclase